MKKKKTAPRRRVKSKPPVKRRSARDPESPLDVLYASPFKNPHYQRLTELAPKIGEAAHQLHVNALQAKGLELPSEKLLHDLLIALEMFRRISRRCPEASLLTLAAEADEMWERLDLCGRIKKLATNLKPWMIESPVETLEWSRKDPGYIKRLRALLRENVDASPSDLEKLIPLLPEQYQEQIEVIRCADTRKNAETDAVRKALAHLCADFLREREARYTEQRRLLQPLRNFFDQFASIHLLCDAGFICEAKKQAIITIMERQSARARQQRHRSRQKKVPAKA
jgi:hypothetical protein